MNTYCFALIFYQILSTHSLRKYIKISLENLYVDIMGLKGLIGALTQTKNAPEEDTKQVHKGAFCRHGMKLEKVGLRYMSLLAISRNSFSDA